VSRGQLLNPLPDLKMTDSCDPVIQMKRQEFLDALYLADGRDDVDHPYHASYTDLLEQWKRYAGLASQWLELLAVDEDLRESHA
jgi:hypothetical protein